MSMLELYSFPYFIIHFIWYIFRGCIWYFNFMTSGMDENPNDTESLIARIQQLEHGIVSNMICSNLIVLYW